jgi:hypothetical protein
MYDDLDPPAATVASPRVRRPSQPRLTPEERYLRQRVRADHRREWARDLLRRFQF